MKKNALFLLVIFFTISQLAAQQPASQLDSLLGHLKQYEQDRPVEKVYLHLDRSYYVAGEDIWFKAYVTVGQFNFLSAISGILYVELIDEEDRVLQSERLPLMSGLSMGDFKLPDTLSEGNYRVRAYTNWMRNFGASYFFDKPIVIGNSFSKGLLTSSKFQFVQDEQQRAALRMEVFISDWQERPLSNRPIRYEISWKGKAMGKGKGMLDGEGRLQTTFTLADNQPPFRGNLLLSVENEQGEEMRKTLLLQQEAFSPSAQFFLEGGSLLQGVFSRVGFRATDEFGRGALVSGYLEEDGAQIAKLSSDSLGIGSFSFTPWEGKNYLAVVDFGAGRKVEQVIAPGNKQGHALAVNNAMEEAIWIQIAQSPTYIAKEKELILLAQHQGELFYAAKTSVDKPEISVSIERKKLPMGLIELLLVDEQMHILAGRSMFNSSGDGFIPLRIETDKISYKAREKVSFKLDANSHRDSILTGSFSMSVTNVSKLPDSALTSSNILSTLLLTTGSGEYVQHPGQYFPESGMNPERNEGLDRLLLAMPPDTSSWNQMVGYAGDAVLYPAEKSLSIRGRVLRKTEGVLEAQVTLLDPRHMEAAMDTIADVEGRFSFDPLIFEDSTRFVVQAKDAKGKNNVELVMEGAPRAEILDNPHASEMKVDANQRLGAYLAYSNKALQELEKEGVLKRNIRLKEVNITAKKENPAKYSSNLNGPGNADQVISGDEPWFGGCEKLEDCLSGRLTGVIFKQGIPYSSRSPRIPMLVVIDGAIMDSGAKNDGGLGKIIGKPDINMVGPLRMVTPSDVISVEVLRSPAKTALYGTSGGGGVLIITTRRSDQPHKFGNELRSPGMMSYTPAGFYKIRMFPAPDYSQKEEKLGKRDLRTTIYWKPDIQIGSTGAAEGFFYAADEAGVYQIVVEGLDTQGHLGRTVHYVKVEN